jgi:oligopeptide/dipeptide ABC transporter ATP-binding protein
VCEHVVVMFAGRVVEQGPSAVLFRAAAHPYTRALIAAAQRASIRVAPEGRSGSGCAFAPRCPWRVPRCTDEAPALRELAGGHRVACHRAEEVVDDRGDSG